VCGLSVRAVQQLLSPLSAPTSPTSSLRSARTLTAEVETQPCGQVRDKSGKSWVPVDVMADLAASATPFLGGHAHEGMALAAEQLRLMHGDRLAEALSPLLNQGYELHIIGHSLGAGVVRTLARHGSLALSRR
jgi:hypothetical protein